MLREFFLFFVVHIKGPVFSGFIFPEGSLLSCDIVYYAVQGGSHFASVDKILKYDK